MSFHERLDRLIAKRPKLSSRIVFDDAEDGDVGEKLANGYGMTCAPFIIFMDVVGPGEACKDPWTHAGSMSNESFLRGLGELE
jgi:hypothetical protein